MSQIDYKKKYLKYKKKYLELKKGGVLLDNGNIGIIKKPNTNPQKQNPNLNEPNIEKSEINDPTLKIKIPTNTVNTESNLLKFYKNKKNNNKLKFLGKGSYGSVYGFEYEGMNLVVKEIQKSTKDINQLEKIKLESDILVKNRYPFIPYSKYKYEELEDKYLIFMKNIDFIELFTNLYEKDNYINYNKKITKILPLVLQMVMLNYYIHSNGLAHLDIKPENYMIEDNSLTHLIDFGLSKCLKKSNLCDYDSRLIKLGN